MKILLRIAAIYSLGWAVVLTVPGWVPYLDAVPRTPELRALANGLAIANLAFAYLFNRAASDPNVQRGVLYAAMMLFGLRGLVGTYQVLYVLDGPAAVPTLVDMVLSLALFVGMLNSLPGTIQGAS